MSRSRCLNLLGVTLIVLGFLGPEPVLGKCSPVPLVKFSPPPFRTGYFEVHNTLNGLPCDQIRCLLIASRTVLAGSDGAGLMIFDGNGWTAYTPQTEPPFPSPSVGSLIAGREPGTYLAGTVSGIVKITLRDKPVFELMPMGTGNAPTAEVSRNVLALADSGTDLFVGTDRQPGKMIAETFVRFSFLDEDTPAGVSCIGFRDKEVLFGNSNGLYRLHEPVLHKIASNGTDLGWALGLLGRKKDLYIAASNGLFRLRDNLENLLPGLWATCLSLPPKSSPPPDRVYQAQGAMSETMPEMWLTREIREKLDQVGALERQTNQFAQEVSGYTIRSTPPPPALLARYNQSLQAFLTLAQQLTTEMQGMARLEKGLWVGTQDAGAILFGQDGVRRDLTTENSKLPSNRITALATDESGETWIGTFDAGLLRYCLITAPRNKDPQPIWNGRANLVRVCGEQVYVCTKENGLRVYDPKTLELVGDYSPEKIKGFPPEITGVAMDQKARLWVSGSSGVWMKDEKGWHRFGTKDGLPDEKITSLECDTMGRIYVTGGQGTAISQHLASFNGSGFTSYSVETLRGFLALPPASAALAFEGMGMTGSYVGTFDLKSPKKALGAYDDGAAEGEVSALFGASEYLWLGTREGNLLVFTGEKFLRVDSTEVGKLGPVAAIARRRNGDIIFVSANRVMLLDGQHFEAVPPVLGVPVNRYTDLAIDTKNADLFWISFAAGDKGGIALYQEPLWSESVFKFPVRSMALADPFIFLVGDEAVYRVMR